MAQMFAHSAKDLIGRLPVHLANENISKFLKDKCILISGTGGSIMKIIDMAKDVIWLSGKEPGKDIEIIFTGIRDSEKLYEELITEGEGIVKTGHEKILVLHNGFSDESKNSANPFNELNFLDTKIKELIEFANAHDAKQIKCKLKEIVPEYTMSDNECVL